VSGDGEVEEPGNLSKTMSGFERSYKSGMFEVSDGVTGT
jgi:hypothetical protein